MYTSLEHRSTSFKRFRDEVRSEVFREADRRRAIKETKEKAKAAQDEKDNAAKDDLIRMLQ